MFEYCNFRATLDLGCLQPCKTDLRPAADLEKQPDMCFLICVLGCLAVDLRCCVYMHVLAHAQADGLAACCTTYSENSATVHRCVCAAPFVASGHCHQRQLQETVYCTTALLFHTPRQKTPCFFGGGGCKGGLFDLQPKEPMVGGGGLGVGLLGPPPLENGFSLSPEKAGGGVLR